MVVKTHELAFIVVCVAVLATGCSGAGGSSVAPLQPTASPTASSPTASPNPGPAPSPSPNPLVAQYFVGSNGRYANIASLALGADGNMWMTDFSASNAIARVTPSGAVTEFPLPNNAAGDSPLRIAPGPDGNMWFTVSLSNRIGRITPSGAIAEFNATGSPSGIAKGPDGNVYFTEGLGLNGSSPPGRIGRIDPSSGVITEFALPTFPPIYNPTLIATGSDGNLWFTDGYYVGRMSTQGALLSLWQVCCALPPNADTSDSLITSIALGPDGNMWFGNSSRARRVTAGGAVTQFCGPATAMTLAADGNLWSTDRSVTFTRLTPNGQCTLYNYGGIGGLAAAPGPSKTLWFVEDSPNLGKVGVIQF